MGGRLIETIAVSIGLRRQHHVVELRHTQRPSLPAGEDLGLEGQSAADVDDGLHGADQIDVEQCEPITAGEMRQSFLDNKGLAEDARRFGQRHRHASLQCRSVCELGVVIRVTKFVSRGLGGVDAATPVEEDQRPIVDERHAERAAKLAIARSGIDPLFVDCAIDEPAERLAVRRERTADDVQAVGP